MTERRQRNSGLIFGLGTMIFCTVVVIFQTFEAGEWYCVVPLGTLSLWGLLSINELAEQNDRRERILKKHGIDERTETL